MAANSANKSPNKPDSLKSLSFDNNVAVWHEGPSSYNLSNGITLSDIIKIINNSAKNSISKLELGNTIEITEPIHFFIKRLGDGVFGEAFLVWVDDSNKYVLKRFHNKTKYLTIPRMISFASKLHELTMLIKVKGNLSIVQLEAAQLDESKNDVYFLYEYVPGMTFEDYYNTDYRFNVGNPDKIERKKEILNDILDAIQELHKLGIFHADIKGDNIFIPDKDTGRKPFLLDLGLSNFIEEESHTHSRIRNYEKLGWMITEYGGLNTELNRELITTLKTIKNIKNTKIEKRFGGSTRKRRKIKKYRYTRSKNKSSLH